MHKNGEEHYEKIIKILSNADKPKPKKQKNNYSKRKYVTAPKIKKRNVDYQENKILIYYMPRTFKQKAVNLQK